MGKYHCLVYAIENLSVITVDYIYTQQNKKIKFIHLFLRFPVTRQIVKKKTNKQTDSQGTSLNFIKWVWINVECKEYNKTIKK